MGVIQRQSLKYTLINFIGTFIGFLSVVFIYPLGNDIYGYFQLLHSYGSILVSVLGFGIHGAIIKFYPLFVQKNKDEQFLSFTLFISSVSVVSSVFIISLFYWIFKPFLADNFENFYLIEDNKFTIVLWGILFLYTAIFLFHASARLRIVIPDLINTVGLKLFLPFMILIYYLGWIEKQAFFFIFSIYFSVICILMAAYLFKIGKHKLRFKFDVLNKPEYTDLYKFMGFSSLNAIGASLTFKMDISMIGPMLGLQATTLYTLILAISNVMDIPAKAINQIAAPVISNNWANNDLKNIQNIYQKSSIFGAVIGVFLFLILFFIWPEIIALMPKEKMSIELELALNVFLFLGLAKLLDLLTGVNSIIISYSKDYKYYMYFLIVLAVINIILNYFFLSRFGITGAAMATFISFGIYNLMKHLFINKRFGFYLKLKEQFKVISIGLLIFCVMWFVSFSFHPIINMILKSLIISMIYISMMWLINPGGELKSIAISIFENIKSKLRYND